VTPRHDAVASVRFVRVGKTYGHGDVAVHALRDVDLSLWSGQLVVVLGPSGSGKTTMLNLVGGVENVSAGSLIVAGRDLSAMDGAELTRYRRDKVGFVFQFFNLIPTLSALENVELVGELVGRSGARAAERLQAVGLGDRMDRFPSALSGGEQQRVAIARALVKEPPLLLCDEPTGSLDLETGRQVLVLLQSASRQDGRTVVLVTHNSAIAQIADRVLRLRSGRVVDDELNPAPLPAEQVVW
jgi:putative ABC transport system ATP-binding protein